MAPESGLVDGVATIGGGDGFLQFQVERGHVLVAQQALICFREGVDFLGDFTTIEVIADRVDGLTTGLAGFQRLAFGVHHGSQCACGIGTPEELAGERDAAIRHEVALRIRPQFEEFLGVHDGHRAHFINGHAVGEFDGRFDDFGEGFVAKLAQGEESGVHHAGDESRKDAGDGDHAFESTRVDLHDFARFHFVFAEEVRGGEFRHGADAGDGIDFALRGADENGSFAAEAEVRDFGKRSREHGGDTRVDSIAALVVETHAGFSGELAAGADGSVDATGGEFLGTFVFFSGLGGGQERGDENEGEPGFHLVGGLLLRTALVPAIIDRGAFINPQRIWDGVRVQR